MINRSNFAKALYPGVSKWYGQAYNEYPVEWTGLYDQAKSTRAYEEDVGVTSFGLAQVKGEGDSITFDDESQAFVTRYSHVVYALGFIITEEMVEDDLYDVIGSRRAKGLAFSMRQTKEVVGADLYNNAFNGGSAGGDGVSMCNTLHPNFAGGFQSNSVATDLSESALESLCITTSKWTNDAGLRIQVMPNSIIVPTDLQFEAERIMGTPYQTAAMSASRSVLRSGTADAIDSNDINVARGKFPGGVTVNHYLTDDSAWFVRNSNVVDGLKAYSRRDMRFANDSDFETSNAKYKASERYSFGYTDWRAISGSSGA
jgi:hypothetical protein